MTLPPSLPPVAAWKDRLSGFVQRRSPSPGNLVLGPVLRERPLISMPERLSAVEGKPEYCDPHMGGAGSLLAEAHGAEEAIEWAPAWYPAACAVSFSAPGMWSLRGRGGGWRGGWRLW